MKNIIQNIKAWLIHKLGGLPDDEVRDLRRFLLLAAAEAHVKCCKPWAKTVQEICRRSDNSYYDWCCEYCSLTCDKRDGWCKRFAPIAAAEREVTGCESSADL